MFKDRKEYRKKFNAAGQLHVGGETLQLNCYDVSVKGAMVEIIPGELLSTVEDFEALLGEDRKAEIFVEDLMMSGEVGIVWVRQDRSRIMMGLEFHNVVHNAHKLWRKRRSYRKEQPFSAELFVDKDRFQVEGINCSTEGVCLRMAVNHPSLKVNALVKLQVKQFMLNALGKVAWIKQDNDVITIGLQIIVIK
jgi:hypothetical protein